MSSHDLPAPRLTPLTYPPRTLEHAKNDTRENPHDLHSTMTKPAYIITTGAEARNRAENAAIILNTLGPRALLEAHPNLEALWRHALTRAIPCDALRTANQPA